MRTPRKRVVKVGDRVTRKGVTGKVTRVSPGGHHVIVKLGRNDNGGHVSDWYVSDLT